MNHLARQLRDYAQTETRLPSFGGTLGDPDECD